MRELNSSYYQIALRINSDEPLAKELQKVMVQLSKVVKDEEELANYDGYRVEFIKAAASLLKAEWVRVKRGERVYRLANLIAGIAVMAFAVAGLWIAIGEYVQAEDGQDAAQVEAKPDETITPETPVERAPIEANDGGQIEASAGRALRLTSTPIAR